MGEAGKSGACLGESPRKLFFSTDLCCICCSDFLGAAKCFRFSDFQDFRILLPARDEISCNSAFVWVVWLARMHEGRIMPQPSKGLAAAWHIQGVAPKEICGHHELLLLWYHVCQDASPSKHIRGVVTLAEGQQLAAGHRVGILDKPIFRYGTASELVDRHLAAVS